MSNQVTAGKKHRDVARRNKGGMEAQATLMMNLSSTINKSITTLHVATSLASGNNSPSSLKRKAKEILELTQMNEYLQPVTKKKSQMSGSTLKTNANYVVSTEQATVNLAIVNGRDPTSKLFTPELVQIYTKLHFGIDTSGIDTSPPVHQLFPPSNIASPAASATDASTNLFHIDPPPLHSRPTVLTRHVR